MGRSQVCVFSPGAKMVSKKERAKEKKEVRKKKEKGGHVQLISNDIWRKRAKEFALKLLLGNSEKRNQNKNQYFYEDNCLK